jgi:carbamoyl-phosphate synthase large subunit
MTESAKIRIAVSGAGGGVGQSIIKSLQDTEYEIVALDGEALGTGLYAAKKSYLIPYANDPRYVETTLEICKKEQCKIFFPGLDAELSILSENIEKFAAIGTIVVVSSKDVIEISDNKMTTFSKLSEIGILVPHTINLAEEDIDNVNLDYPIVLKEREGGARSQNLYIVKNDEELEGLKNQGVDLTAYVAQEYIEGDEFTCGSVTLDGECRGVIVMRRILRDGDTYKCFPVRSPEIEKEVRKVVTAIKPFGACNIQLRVRDGVVYIFEINARCSGTTAARSLSGFNEPKMIADYLLHNMEPSYEIKEQTVLRYWKELVVSNDEVELMKHQGYLETQNPKKL